MPPDPLPLHPRTRLLVLTGAGISAESGLATFRGPDGLWEGRRPETVATPEAFRRDPVLVWRFYAARRIAARAARPNPAHAALVDLERLLGDRFLLATQNVDGLHWQAGSERVAELHGSLWRTRCSGCDEPPCADGGTPVAPPLPRCPACGSLLRPDIVWFGEPLDPAVVGRVDAFMRDAAASGERFVFLAVGTSGVVYPAAGYARVAKHAGAETWLANLETPDNDDAFDVRFPGPASRTLPAIAAAARR